MIPQKVSNKTDSQERKVRKLLKKICQEAKEEPMDWRRFELLTENDSERERLERVLRENNLSRQELAIILFGLRVRPGFQKSDFGI